MIHGCTSSTMTKSLAKEREVEVLVLLLFLFSYIQVAFLMTLHAPSWVACEYRHSALVLIFFNRRVRHNIHSNSPCRQLICIALPLSSFGPFILVFVSRLPSFPGASAAAQFSALDCWWDAVKGNDTLQFSFRLMKIRGFYTYSHKAFSLIWNAHTANDDWLKS